MLSQSLLVLIEIECLLSFDNCLWGFRKTGWNHFVLNSGVKTSFATPYITEDHSPAKKRQETSI